MFKHLPAFLFGLIVLGVWLVMSANSAQAQIPAYVLDNGNQACGGYDTESKPVITDGYYDQQGQPYKDEASCPAPVHWSYTYHGVTYSADVQYDKPTGDDKHCHREADNYQPGNFSGWPGAVRGKFNSENPELKDATFTRVYKACSTLGEGWVQDDAVEHGCKKWINTVYGVCSSLGEGWVNDPEHADKCVKEQPACPTEAPVNTPTNTPEPPDSTPTATAVSTEPPDSTPTPQVTPVVTPTAAPTGWMSCSELQAYWIANGHGDWLLPPHCYASGLQDWFQDRLTWLTSQPWWPW